MKTKLILILTIIVLLLLSISIYSLVNEDRGDIQPTQNKVYQGAVPEGYDEQHFRETGETIKLNEFKEIED